MEMKTGIEPYQMLEQEWANFNGVRSDRMVACSSGTAALHLALESLRLPQGSKIVVPDFTMIACARAVSMAGLVPVFADVDPCQLTLDPASLLEVCEREQGPVSQIRGVIAVHTYGRVCDMDGILRVATEKNLFVIEDLAEAHGVRPHAGSDAACWSFYRNKIVGGEEGGAVYSPYETTYETARCLRCLGFTEAHDFYHAPRGHNYRMANCLADLIRSRLRNVNRMIDRRREVESWYDGCMPGGCIRPARNVVWVYDFTVPEEAQKCVYEALQAEGIPVRYGFKPMTRQPEYFEQSTNLPCSDRASKTVLYFPVNPTRDRPASVMQSASVVVRVLKEHGVKT